jgi:DNA-binding Lrp family transcriptional regulator
MEAYVLMDTDPGRIWEVAESAVKIKGVKKAHAVTGQYDTVAFVEFTKMDDLGKILEKIRRLKGVHRTQTLIAIPPAIGK